VRESCSPSALPAPSDPSRSSSSRCWSCSASAGSRSCASPVYLDRRPPSRTGKIHYLLAAIAFITIAIVAARLPRSVVGDPGWAGISGVLRVVGLLVVAAAIATGLGLRIASLRPFFGLLERSLYVAMLTWFLTVSLHIA